jgi:choline dehydrogenase-like flavoprotein
MSKDPAHGVVDEDLAVHGVPNLHVVSSSVFVTSGQANSTFMIVVFALRLIRQLYGAKGIRRGSRPSSSLELAVA